MDVLYKFVDCEASHQWLFEANLLTHLISLLHKDETVEVNYLLFNVVCAILILLN